MTGRKDFFEALRGLDGGEKLEAMAESLFKEADSEAKSYREKATGLEDKNKSFAEQMEELKNRAQKADELSTQNNDFASQMELLVKQVNSLTEANKEVTREKTALVQEKKDNQLRGFFTDAVGDSFGADGARMAFNDGLAIDAIGYNGDTPVYKGKSGEEAIELFKTDYSPTFQQRNGTGTSGGNSPAPINSLEGLSVEALLADGGKLLK